MRSPDALTTLFRQRGLRVTPQRQCIFRLLQGNDTHPTVEALHEAAQAEMPTISLKTVYQTVHDLDALGEVRVLDLGTGSLRVDPNVDQGHSHLVCSACGRVRDVLLDLPPVEVPRGALRGFTVAETEVIVRGVCENCGARSRRARAGRPTTSTPTT